MKMKKGFDLKKRKDELVLLGITVFVECLLMFWCFNVSDGSLYDSLFMSIGGIVIAMPYFFRIYKYV